MRMIGNREQRYETPNETHVSRVVYTVMVYNIVRQNAWDVLFRSIELSTLVDFHPQLSNMFSKWLAHWKTGTGNFEKKWMCERFLQRLFDRIGPQNEPALR